MMMTIFNPRPGHDNNFDALRIFAASLVIFSHGWELTKTPGEPIVAMSHSTMTGGALGVWIFFVISGFLVSASFENRSLLRFIEARLLRIYPAFLVALVAAVAIGAAVTTLPIAEYLRHEQTWRYVYRALLTDIQFTLPSVYADLPFASGINGSLWTIPIELMMYAGVAILGVCTLLRRPTPALMVLASLVIAMANHPQLVLLIPRVTQLYAAPAVLCFLLGMILYTNRERIPLHGAVAALLVAMTAWRQPPGNLFVCIAIAYAVAWVAFHPRIRLRVPDQIGDISYGLYVYAFPIQQTIIYLNPGIGPWKLFALAFAATALVSWCSWHALEKRALGLKGKLFARRQQEPRGEALPRI